MNILNSPSLGADPKRALFPTIERARRGLVRLFLTPMPQRSAFATIRHRATAAGITALIGNHTRPAARSSKRAAWRTMRQRGPRSFMDRRRDEFTLDEVERIVL
jgi:hypothetical protein